MDLSFYLIQLLNAVQQGFLLFLVASGLTLIFGVMGVINLAHGAFYMAGGYLAWWLFSLTDSFALAVLGALPLALLLGILVEKFCIAFLYQRDHLDQVLMTYGLILVFNEAQRVLWGNDVHGIPVPELLSGAIQLTDTQSYPVYRLFISAVCLSLALGLYGIIQKTRIGMTIRAAASNREMAQAMGVNADRLFTLVFGLGAALAALSGMIAAPIEAISPGMGDNVLIVSFVVVVVGGIGSVRGAFWGAMLIGLADTFGRALLPDFAAISIYAVMAAVLLWRPQGLFGQKG